MPSASISSSVRSCTSVSCRSGGGAGLSRDLLFIRREDDGHVAAFEHRVLFDHRDLIEVAHDAIKEVLPDLRVRDFASAEHDRHLDLVTLLEQLCGGPGLEVDIVFIDLWLHADFAQLHVDLVLFGFALLLGLFVLVAAEVHKAGDGRAGASGDLNEIDVTLPCHGDGFDGSDYADLPALFINEAHFGNPNAFVDAWLGR
jgi:hypothetical protein